MSYNPVNWVNGETPINDVNLNNMDNGIADAHSMLEEHESKIDDFANQQLPEEYVKSAVDTYIEENEAGLALKEEVEALDAKIDAEVSSLSSEIVEVENDLTVLLLETSDNLFNVYDVIPNVYINKNTGMETTANDEGFASTNFIKVEPSTKYTISTLRAYAFYDADKTYISGGGSVTTYVINGVVESPSNAVYFRETLKTPYNNFVIVKGETIIDYVPHYLINDDLMMKYKPKYRNCENLTCGFMGDSITWGYDDETPSQVDYPYPKIIKEKFGFLDCINYGVSGSTIGGDGETIGTHPMINRVDSMADSLDIIVLFGGTNDFGSSSKPVPLGELGDTSNNTFYGAYNNILDKLITKYIGKKIYCVTPLHRRTERNGLTGNTLSQYVNAIRELCDIKGVEVIDLYAKGEFFAFNDTFINTYSKSGLHPNQAWYYILADKIGFHIYNEI